MGGLGSINFSSFNFAIFTNWYNLFLGLFPAQTHWLVSLIVLISIAAAFYVLIRTHWLFIIVLIILFPVIYPILQNFFWGIWQFVVFLWTSISTGIPKS
jgi:hypothetical protein